ncbi:MAG TPA: hypothetical protein VJ801_02615 [Polyangia bacterium]|nr:hypothetical protein [Polyangia bacterium]
MRSRGPIQTPMRATCTTPSAVSNSHLRNDCVKVWPVDDFAFTPVERATSKRFTRRPKDLAQLPALEAALLARQARGSG